MRILTASLRKNAIQLASLLLAVTMLLMTSCNLVSESFYQGKLAGMINMVNKKCPRIVATGVRLDSASVQPKKTVTFHYTMTEVALEDIDTTIWKRAVDSALVVDIRKEVDLKELREHDVTFVYDYLDKNKQTIAKFYITPDKYQFKK